MQSKSAGELVIRRANRNDVSLILSLIKELAHYEHLAHEITATEAQLEASLFGSKAAAQALIAEYQGEPAGFGVYFYNFSTFLARAGIYLEDLYVRQDFRGKGIGRALLVHLAKLVKKRNGGRLEWAVLSWNKPAIKFYSELEAIAMDEWTVFRLAGAALEKLAGES